EAVDFFQRALEAVGHVPETPESRTLTVDLGFDLEAALVPLGAHAEGLAVLRSAESIARRMGDEPRLARALAYRSTMHWEMGESDAAGEAGGGGGGLAGGG